MKYLQIPILASILFALSCHSRVDRVVDACCAKAHPGSAMEMSEAGSTSIYQLAGRWTDQDNRQIDLGALRGRVQLVAMVYTHCGYTCPRLVEDMKSIRQALADSIRDKVGFVLVTLDPDRDTPARLRQFADQKQLGGNWELLRGNSEQVRELSMVLNVQYRSLGNGDISHSGNILVLDREGRVIQSLQGARAAGDGVALVDRLALR